MAKAKANHIRESDYFKAFTETTAIWGISSLVPILSIWLIGKTTSKAGYTFPEGLFQSWNEFFIPSEVFLYVTAIIAPSLSFMFFHWQARRHTRVYFLLLSVIALLFLFTAMVYALSKTSDTLDLEFIYGFALTVYLLSLMAWYLTQVFQRRLMSLVGQSKPESGSNISLDPEE